MKRRSFVAAGAAAAAPAVAQTQNPEVRWRLQSSFGRNLDILFFGAEQVSKRVAELTDNRFQIRAFPAGEIAPGLQVLDGCRTAPSSAGKRRSSTTSARTRRSASSPPSPSAATSASRAPG